MIALADCAIVVSNAERAARWWVDKLGFAVHTVGGGGGHAVMVAPPGDRFVLHLCEGIASVEPGNTGVAFMTDDLEGLVARMLRKGVAFPQPMRKESWGGMAKFADPDGNIFWLLGAPAPFVKRERARRAPTARSKPARAVPGPRRRAARKR